MNVRGRDEREGKNGERSDARRPPIMPRGERVLVSFYIKSARAHASMTPLQFSRLRLSPNSSAAYPL